MTTAPENNRFKAPFYGLTAIIGVASVAYGLAAGVWWLGALGVLIVVASSVALWMIRRGANPKWFRAPLDR